MAGRDSFEWHLRNIRERGAPALRTRGVEERRGKGDEVADESDLRSRVVHPHIAGGSGILRQMKLQMQTAENNIARAVHNHIRL